MNDDIKVYKPTELTDTPFPQNDSLGATSIGGETGGNIFKAQTVQENPFPKKIIAYELTSTALNTKSKKILGEFQFTQQGAIQIGKYENGVSGDIRISPNGLLARNNSGINTVAIDAESGDAIFQGTVRAKDFIIADDQGLISLNNFARSQAVMNGATQIITSSTITDISGAELNFELTRSAIIIIYGKVSYWVEPETSSSQDVFINFRLDNLPADDFFTRSWYRFSSGTPTITTSINATYEFPQGEHNLKLVGYITKPSGTPRLVIYSYYLSYIILGG